MKVLLIDVNCKYSSTGRIVYNLCQFLNANGHEAAVAYGRGEAIDEPGIFKFGIDSETRLHALLARITGYNGRFSPRSTARLLDFIEEFKPDVIHIHELHAYFVNHRELLTYIKSKHIPVVWTFHCEYMYTGKCGHAHECTRFMDSCGSCPYVHDYPKSLFFDKTAEMLAEKKQLLRDMDFSIVTPSQWLKNRALMSFLKDKPISVIHNGIDTGVFSPVTEGPAMENLKASHSLSNKRIILSVAPLITTDKNKGIDTIRSVAAKALEAHPDWHFVLVGAERTENLTENVTAIEATKNASELALWYSLADVFFIASLRENFPTTCVEALCCGTPVAGVADSGGTAETAPAPYGIFTERTPEALMSALDDTLTSAPDSATVSAWARNTYSVTAMCQAYLTLYTQAGPTQTFAAGVQNLK